ncbi:MAG: DUF5989 family protein [Verrucomicrobiota bacterium]
MRLLKHFTRFIGELFSFAKENKAWWIVPIVIILLLATILIVTVSSSSPFIYTLF